MIVIFFVILILGYYLSLFFEPYDSVIFRSKPKTLDGSIYISNSKIHGEGLFLKNDIKKNSILFKAIEFQNLKNNITALGRKINHCKICNTKLLKINADYYIISKLDINKGEELTIDYDDTPKFIKKSQKEYVC